MDVLQNSTEFELLVLMAIIVAGPIVAERLRIPGLVGLIAGGVLVGPFVLGWVGRFSLVAELGSVGILYLMFLAGLEFSLRTFVSNRRMAVVFGLLGFAVPFAVSIWVSMTWLGLGIIGAALVGAMWASNTLVAYPDVQAAGLRENKAVGSAVAGGVIADLLSLTVLAVATSVAVLDTSDTPTALAQSEPPIPVWVALPLLAVVSLVIVPRLAKWFFVRVGRSRVQRFVFALAMMAGAAALATWGGVEGLIGAFLVGLGLNRLVPKSGSLFDRIEFVGSAVFVPAFLVSIGLSIDPRLLFDPDTLVLALVFTGLIIVGKLVAAVVTGLVFGLPVVEVGIMATLSMGQAASTLAISQVGVELGVFDEAISNAAVLAIVAAVFITSYGTRFFIPRVERPTFTRQPIGERVLVDTRGSSTDELVHLAGSIALGDQGVVEPFAVAAAEDGDPARKRMEAAVEAAAALGHDAEGSIRFDDSFADGTLQLAAETGASLLVMAWGGSSLASDIVFGSELDILGGRSPIPVAAAHLPGPWDRIDAITGDLRTEWQQEDAALAMAVARRVAAADELRVHLHTPSRSTADAVLREADDVDVTLEESVSTALRATEPSALVVMSAHALRELGALGPWSAAGAIAGRSVVVVGGPHRLAISSRISRTAVHGMVATQD